MNEQDKKLCEKLNSLVQLLWRRSDAAAIRVAKQSIERLSAEVEIEKGQNEILESANKAFFEELQRLRAENTKLREQRDRLRALVEELRTEVCYTSQYKISVILAEIEGEGNVEVSGAAK